MKVFKRLVAFSLIAISIFTMPKSSFAEIFSNLSKEKREEIIYQKLIKEQQNPNNLPIALVSSGNYKSQNTKNPIIVTEKVKGEILVENCILEQDLIIASKNMNRIVIKNSTLKGDLYIVDTNSTLKLDINNSNIKNIFINSSVNISQFGNKNNINDIVISKDLPKGSVITINANAKKFINNANGIIVKFNGNLDKLVANKSFDISGLYNYKLETSGDYTYPDTFLYDLNDFSPKKGYLDIKDGSSYQDMYELIKREQDSGREKLRVIVKNVTNTTVKNLNDVVLEKFSKYISNHSSGVYVTVSNDDLSNYHILNIYFVYDTDRNKIKQSKDIINKKYNELKHLNGIEYIREVNKFIALDLVYDDSLSKHSMYDAVVGKSAVCEGYAKTGYELLQKKFGVDNTILIVNDDHMWNMVRLGKKWYHVDFTYNDPSVKPHNPKHYSEDFLLLSDSELKKRSNGRKWDYNSYPKAE